MWDTFQRISGLQPLAAFHAEHARVTFTPLSELWDPSRPCITAEVAGGHISAKLAVVWRASAGTC